MIKEEIDVAPMGLGFEWPEELWGWIYANGYWLCLSEDECGDDFTAAVSETPQGVTLYALESPEDAAGGWPAKCNLQFEEIQAISLRGDDGSEIARRWLR